MVRFFDVCAAFFGLLLGIPLLILLWLIGWFYTRTPLFYQERVGRHQKPFVLVKFRTMELETPSVATHLADPSSVTSFGRLMRQTKLDELPQLWNVLKGDMSLVGPRPNLLNQKELIIAREALDVYSVRPGITGLAQINNIDMSDPDLLAKTDSEMITSMSVTKYFKYIFLTISGKGQGDNFTN